MFLKRYEDGLDRFLTGLRTGLAKCSTSDANIAARNILRKEVIQPQVPLRLPCYDFTPVAELTVASCPLERLAHRLRVNPTPMV
jgi:hypothetical protein